MEYNEYKLLEVGSVPKGRVIKVQCRCGRPLFKYYKGGRGRLIKCYFDEIRVDRIGVQAATMGTQPNCPACGKTVGIVRMVHGRPALKLNQGTVRETRT